MVPAVSSCSVERWNSAMVAFLAAKADEDAHDAAHINSHIHTAEIGPQRSAEVGNVPHWAWTESDRLTDIRCNAEEIVIATPAPDVTALAFKLRYSRKRWEDFETWPDDWWAAIDADLERLTSAAQRAQQPTDQGEA